MQNNSNLKCNDCGKVFDENLKKKKFVFNLGSFILGFRRDACPFCKSEDIMPSFGFLAYFTCPKCGQRESHRMSEVNNAEYILVTCSQCGVTSELKVEKMDSEKLASDLYGDVFKRDGRS